MKASSARNTSALDAKTSRSICNAVGERLQQSIRPDFSRLPQQLRQSMDALQRQETDQLVRKTNPR